MQGLILVTLLASARIFYYAGIGLLLLIHNVAAEVNREDINLRDPFIYADRGADSETDTYVMVGTITYDGGQGFDVYTTNDPTFRVWSDPRPAFRRPAGFWGESQFWAPEIVPYNGSYYLFGAASSSTVSHGMFVLKADSPAGPYTPHSSFQSPITDPGFFSIDGTLFLDDVGDPWMVYSSDRSVDRNHILHDMRAVRMQPDLKQTILATDRKLFDATAFPHITDLGHPPAGQTLKIVDGPELYRSKNGSLLLVWSSFTDINGPGRSDYAVTIARSSNGRLDGTWVQETEPLFASHGGHGSIFRDLTGQLRLSLHQPNSGAAAYPSFIPIYDQGDTVRFTEPGQPASTVAYFRFEEGGAGRELVAGVDLLDISGSGNHLRTFSDDTTGMFSAQVARTTVRQTGRPNLLSYDNSQAPGGTAPTRDLYVASGPLDQADYNEWTIEASINLSQQIDGHHHTFVGCDGSGYGADGKLAALYFQVEPDNRLSLTFVDQELDVNAVRSPEALALNQWYHVAAVSDGSSLKLYVDSNDDTGYTLVDQRALAGANNGLIDNGRVWTLGRGMYDNNVVDQFFGLIDEVRISNEALNPGDFLFASPVVGDFNGDGKVDGDDLGIWQNGFGQASGATIADGDADEDGDVDGQDFLDWQENAGFNVSATSVAVRSRTVPEPGAVTLLLCTMACFARRVPRAGNYGIQKSSEMKQANISGST